MRCAGKIPIAALHVQETEALLSPMEVRLLLAHVASFDLLGQSKSSVQAILNALGLCHAVVHTAWRSSGLPWYAAYPMQWSCQFEFCLKWVTSSGVMNRCQT